MLKWLIPDFELLTVLLRAATLSLEALILGGSIFLFFDAIPTEAPLVVQHQLTRITAWFALALAIVQVVSAIVSSAVLLGISGLHLSDVMTANYLIADCILALSAVSMWALLRATSARFSATLLLPGLLMLGASTSLSHAASRVDHRALLMSLTAAHHLGTAAWIGTMPYLLIALAKTDDSAASWGMVRRFSALAIVGVLLIVGAGLGMAWFYIGSTSALYGTTYGVMLVTKIFLLFCIALLAAGNFLLVQRMREGSKTLLERLRSFSEVEIAVGFTIILVAASLTSQPPASDLVKDRLTRHEIVERFRWRWPSFKSPSVEQLTPPKSIEFGLNEALLSVGSAPDSASDRAWTEYAHNVSGLIILASGTLALLAGFLKQRWARIWPLLFIGLSIFILFHSDQENWPIGPRPFWASFSAPDVLEHRLYALLVAIFAIFEWGVAAGWLKWRKASLVFPAICVIGGALMVTHSHSLTNVKEEMLLEMNHTPLALLGVIAGCSRWLEVRLPNRLKAPGIVRFATNIWPICLMLVGLVLIDYRES